MADEQKNDKDDSKPLTLPEVVWSAAQWLARRELIVRIAMVAFLIGLGVTGLAYAQDAGVKLIAPIDARVTKLEENQLEMQRMTIETNATVKIIAIKMGITPLSLAPESKDGGP